MAGKICVEVPTKHKQLMQREAESRGCSISRIVRELVEDFLAAKGHNTKTTEVFNRPGRPTIYED